MLKFNYFRVIIVLLLSCSVGSGYGQDTLYINLDKAVDLLKSNNFQFQNAQLSNDVPKSLSGIGRTGITYEYGQLYSPDNSWKVEVSQDFGNILENLRNTEKNEVKKQLFQSEYHLEHKKLEIQVKSLVLQLVYLYNVLENHKLLVEYTNQTLHVSNLKSDLGETEPLYALKVASKVSKVENQVVYDEIHIEKVQNKLKALLNIEKVLIPTNRKMELYMVSKPDDTVKYSGAYFDEVFLNAYHLSTADIPMKKAALFPHIKVGLFYQEIGSNPKLTGISASASFPLWHKSYAHELKASKLNSQVQYNNYLQVRRENKTMIENLLLDLDEYFLEIRRSDRYDIPASNFQINTAIAKYQNEDIEYEEYIKDISEALAIKQHYWELINKYNQTALQLELYLK